jgi:nucleoside-triphosphatase THEP1
MPINTVVEDFFINRVDELNFIRTKQEAIKTEQRVFDFILTISGIPGIGKSYLLNQTAQEARNSGLRVIKLNCSSNQKETYFLQEIAKDSSGPSDDWQHALREYQLNPQDQFCLDNLIENLAKQATVLLIDDCHHLTNETQQMLEDVFEQLQDMNRMFVILAGRSDLRWNSFELRRRTRAVKLLSFPRKETAQLLSNNPLYATISDQIYNLTRGYPLAVVETQKWLDNHLNFAEPNLSQQVDTKEADIVFNLFNVIFEHHILRGISDSERVSQILKHVSPLRRFDDNILSMLLTKIDSARFENINTLHARARIRQVAIQTYLIRWESGRMAYTLDRPIRQLLTLEMHHRDPSRLREIHRTMQEWYQDAIDQVTQKDSSAPQSVIYLLEHLFHFAQLWQLEAKSQVDLETEIQQKVDRQFAGYQPRERNHFQEEFQRDEELAELLGNGYGRLIKYVAGQVD